MREVHERPEGMEEGVVIMTGLDVSTVLDSIPIATYKNSASERATLLVKDYFAPDVSDKVLKIILSYTGFINRRVWRKND